MWQIGAGLLRAAMLSVNTAGSHVTPDSRQRAVARFWRWQLHKRLIHRPALVELATGGQMLLPPWSRLAGTLAANGLTEPREQGLLAATVLPGEGVVDVGVNIGLYSIQAGLLGGRVVGFEPHNRSRIWAAANLRLNRLTGQVRLRPEALSNYLGQGHFTTELDVNNRLSFGEDGPQQQVDVTTLDRLEADLLATLHRIDLIKVDVEGSDLAVLQGGRRLLGRHHPMIVVEIWD
jgi:FkbM family methyltransferase